MIDKKKMEPTVRCSVCVATFQRPHLLKKLLISLENQMLPEGIELEVIIVDNDPAKSAEAVVQEFKKSANINLSYFAQPVKNISLTRNMAVEKASGEYILFIDDDEAASDQWVYHLFTTMEKYGADGVFGPLVPEFNAQAPKWMRRRDLFYGPLQKTGEAPQAKWTGNALIKASLLKAMNGPFDSKYGTSGGEDTHLFARMQRQGARFVYCQEAWVSEYLPPERTRFSYLFLRRIRSGNVHTRRAIEFTSRNHIWMRLFMIGKSILFGSTSIVLAAGHLPSAMRRTYWLMKLASNFGRFLAACGWSCKGYR